jgi:hypothetical protein
MTAPAPGGGGGDRRPGRVGSMRYADLRELETGEGETPTPRGDIPTVHLQGHARGDSSSRVYASTFMPDSAELSVTVFRMGGSVP